MGIRAEINAQIQWMLCRIYTILYIIKYYIYIIKWEIIILMLLIVCILRQDFDCILYKEIVGFE